MTIVSRPGRSAPDELDPSLLEVLPRQGEWSADEYLWLTDRTSRLIEYSDGYLEVLPMPTDEHQAMLKHIFRILDTLLERMGGTVMFAALRLQIAPRKYREPDLLVLLSATDPRRQSRYWLGADLVVEIVSPDAPKRDTVKKRREYARASIPEYWVVNPLNETITVLRLEGNRYVEHGVFARGSTATSALLPDFSVEVSACLDAK